MSTEQSKRQQKFDERRQKARQTNKRKQLMVIGLTVLGALIFLGALIYPSYKPITGLQKPELRDHPQVEMNRMGDPAAPVQIVVYSDFLCSYCSQFYADSEGKLIKDYIDKGLVSYTYRVYITHAIEDSQRAAEGAYCAGEQGKFWDMHDILFANYSYGSMNGFSNSVLKAMAKEIGLDMKQYSSCMDNHTYADQIEQDKSDGKAAGVNATPTFFVNGQEIRGARPYEVFQQVIEQELAAQK
jgi:protein-disulfide isomerase